MCAGGDVAASQVAVLVASLADNSMVVPLAADGRGRYGMLETLRLYGTERLDTRRESDRTRKAHALYFVGLAEEAEVGLRGAE